MDAKILIKIKIITVLNRGWHETMFTTFYVNSSYFIFKN